ncbi:hypothetical protein NA78x_002493 [Anatilimnocola sp. NA78]|uniref:hypothetical protein n=1 Tax=Anatilimnocola sp. NA78 TaxID=3415683 RepID=UPI003CE51E2B
MPIYDAPVPTAFLAIPKEDNRRAIDADGLLAEVPAERHGHRFWGIFSHGVLASVCDANVRVINSGLTTGMT